MERQGDEIHVDETEASGGAKKQGMRYVLAISVILAIVALTLIWVTGALSSTDDSGGYDDTRTAVEAAEDDISTIEDSQIMPGSMDGIEEPVVDENSAPVGSPPVSAGSPPVSDNAPPAQ